MNETFVPASPAAVAAAPAPALAPEPVLSPAPELAPAAEPARLHRPASPVSLPHHRLVAYSVAVELLAAVRTASVRDAKLRDEALRSAKSACLNTAEGAGRVSRPDKARSFAIARAEAGEAAAAVEIAALTGDATPTASAEVNRLASRLVALLTGLIR